MIYRVYGPLLKIFKVHHSETTKAGVSKGASTKNGFCFPGTLIKTFRSKEGLKSSEELG